MDNPIIHSILSVYGTNNAEVFNVKIDLTDSQGFRSIDYYCSTPNDPFGVNPTIRQWLFENQGDYEILPPLHLENNDYIKTPKTIALSKLSITDGLVEGFTVDSALSGGFQVDTGKFMMFFAAPQPDINYIVNVFDGGLFRCYVQPEDYAEDYFIVTTTTLSGDPSDPACLSIIIMRAE